MSQGFKAPFLSGLFLLLGAPLLAEEPTVEQKPLQTKAYVDIGQIVNGRNAQLNQDLENVLLQRTGISITTNTIFNKHLSVKVGVGGLFWYPIDAQPEADHTRIIKFGPGISEASGEYFFGEPGQVDGLKWKFGFFSYKYNPDARNLGEYLFRSEAYPHFTKTGGWSFINSAAYGSLGTRFSWTMLNGALTHDFLMFSEYEEAPIFDFSPTYVATFKSKVVEVGAGVSFHRWLPIIPSQETPKVPENHYVTVPNFPSVPELLDTAYIDNTGSHTDPANIERIFVIQEAFAGGTLKEMESHVAKLRRSKSEDPIYNQKMYQLKDPVARQADPTLITKDDPKYAAAPFDYEETSVRRIPLASGEYLTFKAIKLMARVGVDLKPLLGMPAWAGPDDLRLFGEVAVLGVQNQAYYYPDIMNRIPVMFGANLPTFRLLDYLSVQGEYYHNPYPESREQPFRNLLPIWALPEDNPALYVPNHKDDWRWSVNLKRTLHPGLSLFCQAASDHMRLRDFNVRSMYAPVTNRPGEWYYIFRLDYGI